MSVNNTEIELELETSTELVCLDCLDLYDTAPPAVVVTANGSDLVTRNVIPGLFLIVIALR